jgi:hypothetical protein
MKSKIRFRYRHYTHTKVALRELNPIGANRDAYYTATLKPFLLKYNPMFPYTRPKQPSQASGTEAGH